jgi:hypothetical protein
VTATPTRGRNKGQGRCRKDRRQRHPLRLSPGHPRATSSQPSGWRPNTAFHRLERRAGPEWNGGRLLPARWLRRWRLASPKSTRDGNGARSRSRSPLLGRGRGQPLFGGRRDVGGVEPERRAARGSPHFGRVGHGHCAVDPVTEAQTIDWRSVRASTMATASPDATASWSGPSSALTRAFACFSMPSICHAIFRDSL